MDTVFRCYIGCYSLIRYQRIANSKFRHSPAH